MFTGVSRDGIRQFVTAGLTAAAAAVAPDSVAPDDQPTPPADASSPWFDADPDAPPTVLNVPVDAFVALRELHRRSTGDERAGENVIVGALLDDVACWVGTARWAAARFHADTNIGRAGRDALTLLGADLERTAMREVA